MTYGCSVALDLVHCVWGFLHGQWGGGHAASPAEIGLLPLLRIRPEQGGAQLADEKDVAVVHGASRVTSGHDAAVVAHVAVMWS